MISRPLGRILWLLTFVLLHMPAYGQIMEGTILGSDRKPIPFAIVKAGNTGQGTVSDLNGYFRIEVNKNIPFLEFSSLGYKTKKLSLPAWTPAEIVLDAEDRRLDEVVITPPYDKINRIIAKAAESRPRHNPDKYEWYRCNVYYKMAAGFRYPDTLRNTDTSAATDEFLEMMKEQHLLLSETYSIRTWRTPQQLQEEVVATKLSGFDRPLFTGLITDVLPFHSAGDFITLNGYDYHNPVSPGFRQRHHFHLVDEFLDGKDTVWVLSYRPKRNTGELSGKVYIHSCDYAIMNLIAYTPVSELKRTIRIEQQYRRYGKKWFPHQLNYLLNWEQKDENKRPYTVYMKGSSVIDSVSFREDKGLVFDKVRTVKILPGADHNALISLKSLRPEELDDKEQRTYQYMDSAMHAVHAEDYVHYLEKLADGKFPCRFIDVNLDRLYTYNRYEKSRLGVGLQTNEKLLKHFSAGGWAGYGTGDNEWKYGVFGEYRPDDQFGLHLKLAYNNELRDPGRVLLHKDLDRNHYRNFLMFRVDRVKGLTASVKKTYDYLSAELSAKYEQIIPGYDYALVDGKGAGHRSFNTAEVALGLRYAYGERTAPAFGKYYATGTKFPVFYVRLTGGSIHASGRNAAYVQLLTAVAWRKHISRIGNERLLLMTGKSWSADPLPVSKLFAGNGYNGDDFYAHLYFFGGMQTMYPYAYYSDEFIALYLKHDFDFRLYNEVLLPGILNSAPVPGLGYNLLRGRLKDAHVHRYISFRVPESYHELGFFISDILRYNYVDFAYLTFMAGYFQYWSADPGVKGGKFVFGFGIGL